MVQGMKLYGDPHIISGEIIFNGLNILSQEETLDEIIKYNRSISRFGDGEFNIILGKRIGFQEVNMKLIKKLKQVLKSKKKGLLVGIFFPVFLIAFSQSFAVYQPARYPEAKKAKD